MAAIKERFARLSTFSHPVSLLVWLAIQLLVLLLGAMQVPLSEQFPRPAERLAAIEMLVAQIALGALLFPILMPNTAAVLVMAAATWPFLLLAGILSSTPIAHLLQAAAFVSLWLISLGTLSANTTSLRWKMWWVAVGATVAIGGAIAAYLRLDFGTGDIDGLSFGPIVGGIHVLSAAHGRIKAWLFIFAFLIIASAARFISMKLSRKPS